MAKRKKHKKLRNGYGNISFLGKGRRNPYCVRPPVTEFDENGKAIHPSPICYTDTWEHGFIALTAWKAGTYTPGMETKLDTESYQSLSTLADRVLADYARISRRMDGMTLTEVFKAALSDLQSHKELSKSTVKAYNFGYSHCERLHNRIFADIKHYELQELLDECELSSGSKRMIRMTFNLCYKYAVTHEMINIDRSKNLMIDQSDVKHGEAFSEAELKYMWEHKDDDDMKRILIMCYSGFRLSAYESMEVNLEEKYFRGGVKTAAGKNRIVPIHSAILPFVAELTARPKGWKITKFITAKAVTKVNPNATPHWTRHTFSALCEKYRVTENDRKRMLGHVIGNITNDIYGHRTVEELREEIEKIQVPKIDVQNSVQQ